jgi:hypothetical protein
MPNSTESVGGTGVQSLLKPETTTIARHWWLTPAIPATQEAEIRRFEVQSQP